MYTFIEKTKRVDNLTETHKFNLVRNDASLLVLDGLVIVDTLFDNDEDDGEHYESFVAVIMQIYKQDNETYVHVTSLDLEDMHVPLSDVIGYCVE
jgi:hypothetical protein